MLDISPFMFECYPYIGKVQVIESEGCIPSVVRVGVIALICNTRGDERLLFLIVDYSVLNFKLLLLNMCCFEVIVMMLKMLLRIPLRRC